MKKLVIMLSIVGFAAAAAQAQGYWDMRAGTEAFRMSAQAKSRVSEQKKEQEKLEEQMAQRAQAEAERAAVREQRRASDIERSQKQINAANKALKALISENAKFAEQLQVIIQRHSYVAEVLAKNEPNESFHYQACGFAMEDLASAVNALGDETLIRQVKVMLNHGYYYAHGLETILAYDDSTRYTRLISLSEIAKDVADGFNFVGSGIAEVKYGDFYQDLQNIR